MKSFWTAFFLIFVAELGDKTQFMTLALSSRYAATTVLIGVTLGTALVSLVSVALGGILGSVLPHRFMNIAAGIIFILFGLFSLKHSKEEENVGPNDYKKIHSYAWLAIACSFFLAELADKTMLATITIASRDKNYFAIWLGSTLGLLASNALAIVAGKMISQRLTDKTMHFIVAFVYIAAGALALWQGLSEP